MEEVVDLNTFIDSNDLQISSYTIEESTIALPEACYSSPGILSGSQLPDSGHVEHEELKRKLTDLLDKLGLTNMTATEKLTRQKKAVEHNVNIWQETWTNFIRLQQAFSLEGDPSQWIACLIFISYYKIIALLKKKLISTEHDEEIKMLEKCSPALSLRKLLKLSVLSLRSFLSCVKKVIDMLQVPNELCTRVEQLDAKMNVSCILFEKYKLMYLHLFNCSPSDTLAKPCKQIVDLFNFGWTFFIFIKENYPQISSDLVNSYHLLLCCINLIYQNVLSSSQTNSNWTKMLQVDLNSAETTLIDYLCKKFEGQALEAKTINEHYFKHQINELSQLGFCGPNGIIDLNDLPDILNKTNQLYEELLDSPKSTEKVNVLTCLSQVHTLDIDERLFLENSAKRKNSDDPKTVNLFNLCGRNDQKKDIIKSQVGQIGSTKTKDNKDRFKSMRSNGLLEDSMDSEECKYLEQLVDVDLTNRIRNLIIDKIQSIEMNKDSDTKHDEKNQAVENFLEILSLLYYRVLELMLWNEKKRTGDKFKLSWQRLASKDLRCFHKCLYTCCFEVAFNSTNLSDSSLFQSLGARSNKRPRQDHFNSSLNIFLSSHHDEFAFPWCLNALEVSGFDLFLLIELFIKATNPTNATKDNPEISENILFERETVKHLNKLEESLLENYAWSHKSSIWSELTEIKLDESYLENRRNNEHNIQAQTAFPLYEDVCSSSVLTTGSQCAQNPVHSIATSSQNGCVSNTISNGEIILNLTPNPSTSSASSASYQSPVKHPTITRVVGVSANNDSLNTSNRSNGISSNSKTSTQKPMRLSHISSGLMYFLRKFYNLANSRMCRIVDDLDLVSRLADLSSQSNNQNKAPNTQNSAPNLTTNLTSTNNCISTLPSNKQLANELKQIVLQTIWNVFEYALCGREQNWENMYLICNRHLDQLLLCSIYLTCRLCDLETTFTDIISVYRSHSNTDISQVYRKVLTCQEPRSYTDLITFYNSIFAKLLKPYALRINELERMTWRKRSLKKSHSQGELICLSPVPKMQTPNSLHTHFTPVKINLNNQTNVFVSPGKLINSLMSGSTTNLSSSQLIQQQFRNKLSFSFGHSNPNNSISTINTMIKKNEIKLKPPMNTANKLRLFSDITSMTKTDSEKTDGEVSKFTALQLIKQKSPHISTLGNNKNTTKITSFTRPTTNFLSTVVGSRLGYMSKNSSNLVTMVINNNGTGKTSSTVSQTINTTAPSASNLPLGSNFSRKLQNIQSERLN